MKFVEFSAVSSQEGGITRRKEKKFLPDLIKCFAFESSTARKIFWNFSRSTNKSNFPIIFHQERFAVIAPPFPPTSILHSTSILQQTNPGAFHFFIR
jgi:hypothetical protein